MLLIFTTVALFILSGAELDLFIPSFPQLQEIFHLTPFLVQLTISINFIAYCICCLFTGPLGDKYNRRHVIIYSLWIFLIGSIFCAGALNFPLLILGRFFQGVGMAGPMVLAYAVIAETYPLHKQVTLLAVLNGFSTMAMAFAPMVGSYITLYFGWRGNFVLLLILAVICLVTCYLSIPHSKGDASLSLSPRTYLPLFKYPQLLAFGACICCLVIPFWVFIGMSPIFYMESLGVPLEHFGYYQGAIAGVFGITSLLAPLLLKVIGHRRCLVTGIILCILGNFFILLLTILNVRDPLLITGSIVILVAGVLFPFTMLYPQTLQLLPAAKGRIIALIAGSRLIVSALCLQWVSYFYNGEFFFIGIVMFVFLTLALLVLGMILRKNWLNLST